MFYWDRRFFDWLYNKPEYAHTFCYWFIHCEKYFSTASDSCEEFYDLKKSYWKDVSQVFGNKFKLAHIFFYFIERHIFWIYYDVIWKIA